MVIRVRKARKLHRQKGDFSSVKIEVFELDDTSGFRRKATSKTRYAWQREQSKRSGFAQSGCNKDWRLPLMHKERGRKGRQKIKRSKIEKVR